jgi:hypothetical protein
VACADDGIFYSRTAEAEDALRERNLPRPRTFVEAWQTNQIVPRRAHRYRINAEPLLVNFLDFLNEVGIPLRQHHDPRGLRAIGIAASFRIGAEYPAVNFHLADRCPEPLNAFYRGGRGLSWAFVWPIDQFAVRLEGGDDSEFGSFAIAGTQWNHPRLPLALGLGIPVHMKHADGIVGLIFQVRAKLN